MTEQADEVSPPSTSTSCAGSPTWPSRARRRPARRSTPSTSTRCPTATPAPTCSSPSRRPATRWREAAGEHPGDLRGAMQAYARGALLGARGNSGVILSQLVGALLRRIGQAGPDDRSAAVFAEGMALATEAGYAAVGQPVEGTILSVAQAQRPRPRSEAAEAPENRLGDVVHAAATPPARPWPARRTSCPCSRTAGVVDAGGRGLCVVLDAAESAITGRRPTTGQHRRSAGPRSRWPAPDR